MMITPSQHPLRVFISSVMGDELRPWRAAALETIASLSSLTPWAFEAASASSEEVRSSYLRMVRESEFVVWLVGSARSDAVEAEIRVAMDDRKHLLVFLLPDTVQDAATERLRDETRVKWSRVRTIEDFRGKLSVALQDEIARAVRDNPGIAPLAEFDQLLRESLARCTALWSQAGIALEIAESWATTISEPVLPERLQAATPMGRVALVGGMGAGKSLCAERWLQKCISRSIEDSSAPLPAYVDASYVAAPLIDVVKNRTRSMGRVGIRGAAVVLDDLSRCDDVEAGRLWQQALEVSRSFPQTTVLVTTRPIPGVVGVESESAVPIASLTEEASIALVGRAHGGDLSHLHFWNWPPALREAVGWPLFAILTGVYLRDARVVTRVTYSDLLTALLNDSLGVSEAARVAAIGLLRRLAVLSIEQAGSLVPTAEIGPKAELRELLALKLIELRGDRVWIPLDILREWLAAEALARGEIEIGELLDSPRRLHRWRYPIMASIGSSSFERSVDVLGPIFERRPGLAARLISEDAQEFAAGRESALVSDALTVGGQVRLAMGLWAESLGPVSVCLPAVGDGGELRGLGVAVKEERLTTRWRRRAGASAVTEISAASSDPEWISVHSGQPSAMLTWPWSWTLSEVRTRLGPLIRAKDVFLAEGPLLHEWAYDIARQVIRPTIIEDGEAVPLEDVSAWLQNTRDMFPSLGPHYSKATSRGMVTFDPARLERAVDSLASEGQSEMRRLFPAPDYLADREFVDGGWTGHPIPLPYSDEHPADTWKWFGGDAGVKRAVEGVLVAALDGYRASVSTWLPRLLPDLAHHVLQPADVRVRLFRPEQPGYGGRIAFMLLPKHRDDTNSCQIEIDTGEDSFLSWDEQSEWYREQTSRIRQYRPDEAWWLRPNVHQETMPLLERLPASRFAMLWLYLDLLDLSLVEGMAPNYSMFW